jgi:hypothetical protein
MSVCADRWDTSGTLASRNGAAPDIPPIGNASPKASQAATDITRDTAGTSIEGGEVMARRIRSKDLETRSTRLRLARRKKPYAVKIMRGVSLLYRRNETAGPWMVRVCRSGEDWTERLALVDDFAEANGDDILDFWQAQDHAREQAHVGKPTHDLSIMACVERYEHDLIARDNDPGNARRVLFHLAGSKLASKLVTASSLSDYLSEFRDELKAKGSRLRRLIGAATHSKPR